VNKHQFTSIVGNQSITNPEDTIALQKIANQHPYSQIIHTLLAKAYKQSGSEKTKAAIQHAAIYATDRVVLKNVIESNKQKETVVQASNVDSNPGTIEKEVEPKKFDPGEYVVSEIDQIRKDIFKNLDLLKISKQPFYSETTETPVKTTKKKAVTSKKKDPSKKTSSKNTETKVTAASVKKSSVKKKAKPVKKRETKAPKTNTGKNETLSQKEQVDLIEKFIKSPPKISKSKSKTKEETEQPDLSQNTANFEEEFASENLAQILAKQGNNEKAIEIYKKLIWKFPQKKAYFATQIEGLKK